jgi:outer membrane receptor protein involved in Fe transport
VIFNVSVYAQITNSITGKVLDIENSPIEFANVFVTTEIDSSKAISGSITGNLGQYTLANVKDGKYYLHVRFLGFASYKQIVLIDHEKGIIELPPIILKPDSNLLGEVTITSIRNMVEKTEQGILVKASENLTQIGGTAADLMKNMPGVLIGSEGELLLRGKSPLILINGKVSGVGGVDRSTNLELIPASSIESIEIITNPSAKYDTDAESGIINLILKKNTNTGTNGAAALGGGFGERYRVNASLMLNRNTGKWNFGLAYDNWFTTRTRTVKKERTQYNSIENYYLSQPREDERTVQTQTARFNMGFTPNKKNSFSLEGIWLFEGQDNLETIISTYETASHLFTSKNSRFSNEIRRFHTGELIFNYTRNFNRNRALTFDASSAVEYNRENTDISTQGLTDQNLETGSPFLQKTHSYEDANLTNITLNYANPVRKIGIIETGYKATIRSIKDDYLRSNEQNGSFITIPAHTDRFNFNEQIHALYLQYTGWIGTEQEPVLKYNVGIRPEQVWNTGKNAQLPYSFSNDDFNIFPSASFVYYTPGRNMLKLAYGKRINRPTIGQYSPFIDITDSLNVWSGNPDIQPELSHAFDLTYNHELKNVSFTASLFYRLTRNSIYPVTLVDSNGVSTTRPENFDNSSTYGAELLLRYSPINIWTINLDASLYEHFIEQDPQLLNVQKNQLTGYLKFINSLDLWKNGKVQVTANYRSPEIIPQGIRKEVYFVDIGFQQKILKGQGRLALTLTDIFNTQRNETSTSDINFEYTHYRKVDTRAIMMIFAYTFKSEFKEKLLENKFKND